jgi:hypothetical protein
VLFVLGTAGAGVFAALGAPSSSDSAPVLVDLEPQVVGARPDKSPTTGDTVQVELDMVRGSLTPALEMLESELGPVYRAMRMVIYPEYVVVTVEPPHLPGELDRWVLYPPDRSMGPDPENNPGDVDADLFWVSELDPAILATLPARAEEALAGEIPGGEAAYFVIDRSTFDDDVVAITVYVHSERRTGYVRFTTAGEVLRLYGG